MRATPSIRVISLALSVAALANGAEPQELGLSDEVVPIEEFGEGLAARPRTVTEAIDDHLFPENLTRTELLAARAPDDTTTDIPERKSLFGQDRFLSPGPIDPGIESPSGATWRPSFFVFGTYRSALQSFEAPGGQRTNEWANRLDLFGNLSLTSTERILIGFRPLDDEGIFTGLARTQGEEPRWKNGFEAEPHTFFVEGYLDELFPRLDPEDRLGLDLGFSFGRQPLRLQNGILADDNVDALGLTKHNFFRLGASATRFSTWFAFNEIHRGDNRRDSGANLFAISTQFDYPKATWEVDAAYVDGTDARSGGAGDGAYAGVGRIRRFGYWNSTFRANASWAMHSGSPAVDDGVLLTHQLSRTMKKSDDVLAFSVFREFGDYTSAARDPAVGGPLGGYGFLQQAVGIGGYGAPLNLESSDTFGFEISYQHFLDAEERRQILLSAGAARSEDIFGDSTIAALGLQYQQALSDSLLWRLGSFATFDDDGGRGFGLRTEILKKF